MPQFGLISAVQIVLDSVEVVGLDSEAELAANASTKRAQVLILQMIEAIGQIAVRGRNSFSGRLGPTRLWREPRLQFPCRA